tara:strand:+ start:387 stop:1001 length:615 start_codon:yes stop_codon:yes gene_type:complete
MTGLALLRHGRTAWNEQGRLTGRADIPLSPAGRAELARLRPPAAFADATWHVSPLVRARETAALLRGTADAAGCRVDERLQEMDFGAYEGETLSALRERLGDAMRENEDRGLDFQPPGGESPRSVQHRLQPFLRELAGVGGLHVAVCHKSVIRCILALAYDWPMLGRPPAKLRWDCLHLFELEADGRPRPRQMNIPLQARSADS